MGRPIRALAVSAVQRSELQALARRPTTPQRQVWRAQIILHRAEGLSQEETAQRVGVNRPVVALWEKRFLQAGLAGLADAKGRGRKPSIDLAIKGEIISRATRPPAHRRRWRCDERCDILGL